MLKKYSWIKNLAFVCLFALLAAQIGNRLVLSAVLPRLPDAGPAVQSMIPQTPPHRKAAARKTLSSYQVIPERNIFNSQSRGVTGQDPADRKPDVATLQKAELNVQLIGTVVGPPETSFAIIEDQRTREQQLYQLDDIIQDTARVTGIERCRVMVIREGRDEVLECLDEGEARPRQVVRTPAGAPQPAAPGGSDTIRRVSDTEYLIDQSEVESALTNINQLMTQIRVVPNFEDGVTNGFKVFAIRPNSIFSRIGLQNGDVIQRINDQEITTPDRAFQAFNMLRNERSLSVDILRRGSTQSLRYEIR